MMRKKLLVLAVILAALVPVFAAGRPPCCIASAQATVTPVCCRTMPAHAVAHKGCCKAPPAPRLNGRATDDATLATTYSVYALAAPVMLASPNAAASALRIARHLHVANSPDDSPPDLLSRNAVLLI
jgi:hypothetical protein